MARQRDILDHVGRLEKQEDELAHERQLLARRLCELRKERGMTQSELARRAEIGQGYLSQVEHGLRTPSVFTLRALAEVLVDP